MQAPVDRRALAWALAPALVLVLWTGVLVALLWFTSEAAERTPVMALLEPRAALVVMAWVMAALALGVLSRRLHERWVRAPRRLADQARALVSTPDASPLDVNAAPTARPWVQAVNALAAQRQSLQNDMAERVRSASAGIEQERSRLAALMSELTQAVVVCNLDGQVLLYNEQAQVECRALSDAPLGGPAGASEWLGLGRSIYAVLDRQLVTHALDTIGERMRRKSRQISAQFVTTTRGGQLLRVQVAPVHAVAEPVHGSTPMVSAPLSGFVLMLENITREFHEESLRDRLLHELTEGGRASLGALKAAVEMLDLPDVDTANRERFHGVIREEVERLSRRLHDVSREATQVEKTRWPLTDMLGRDLVHAAVRRIESGGRLRASASDVAPALWLRVDSYSLLQALRYLAERLHDEYGIARLELRLSAAEPIGRVGHAHLDLLWTGQAMSTETMMQWELDTMGAPAGSPVDATTGNEATVTSSLSVRDVVERHGGEFWFERERVRHAAFFRFLLPVAADHEPEQEHKHKDSASGGRATPHSRPEFYDFDLFKPSQQAAEQAETRLLDLAYTVFDTETTGLDPSAGDEIIQIGATRIVAGKLRQRESFEQLIDPRRDIPAVGIAIHGIEPAMVRGSPTIDQVLPRFHAFARDTVLVAHNAAFDMRFLQLKEARTGVRFEQPVLDTLLLSAVAQPDQTSHGLEAIAHRLGVTIAGRHSALGDATATAEVFLKLLPLLAERGIHTLGQAREAAAQTRYAKLSYE